MSPITLDHVPPRPAVVGVLRKALDHMALDVVYWRSTTGIWIDQAGLPVPQSFAEGRTLTPIERDGDWVIGLLHDGSIDDPDVIKRACMPIACEIDEERHLAELRAQIRDEQASRARIVAASDRQRRRFERNLHDGAQQRLVGLALTLRLATKDVSESVGVLLNEAVDELDEALGDLRELARGLHPAIVTDAGFAAAVETLAERPGLPVELDIEVTDLLPEPVAVAAYYLVAESLANATRYSEATHTRVEARVIDNALRVAISDDGVGGVVSAGSGLTGLADRIGSLGGHLVVDSEPGIGTTVRATIPLIAPAAFTSDAVDDILLRVVEPDDVDGPFTAGTARHARWLRDDRDRRLRALKWQVWQSVAGPGEILEAQPEEEDILNAKAIALMLGGMRRIDDDLRKWFAGYYTAFGFSDATIEAMLTYDDSDRLEELMQYPRVAMGKVVNLYEALRALALARFDSQPIDLDPILRAADAIGVSRETVAALHEIVLEERQLRRRRHEIIVAPAMPKVLNASRETINTNAADPAHAQPDSSEPSPG